MSMETESMGMENGSPKVQDNSLNPWLRIWTATEETLFQILYFRREDYVHRIYMALGLVFILAVRAPGWLAETPHPIGVMIQVLLLAPVGGIVGGYIFAAVVRNLSIWAGHVSGSQDMRLVTAWTHLPFILAYGIFAVSCVALNGTMAQHDGHIWLFEGTGGWLPFVFAAPFFLWGLYIRLRAFRYLLNVKAPKMVLIWLGSLVLIYLPTFLIGMVYFFLFTTAVGNAQG